MEGGHLGMSFRDTDNLQKNCTAYIYIYSYFFPHRGKGDSGLSLETIQLGGPVGICLFFSEEAVTCSRGPVLSIKSNVGLGPSPEVSSG